MNIPIVGAKLSDEEKMRVALNVLQLVGPVAVTHTHVKDGVATTDSELVQDELYELRKAAARFLIATIEPEKAMSEVGWQQ